MAPVGDRTSLIITQIQAVEEVVVTHFCVTTGYERDKLQRNKRFVIVHRFGLSNLRGYMRNPTVHALAPPPPPKDGCTVN